MEVLVRVWFLAILLCAAFLPTLGQMPSSKYQPGTIMAVAAHSEGKRDADVTQYDVTVKVANTTYVVLFTPLNGSNTVKYAIGDELLVLVGSNTLTFNSATSGTTAVPILSHQTLPAQTLDQSRTCGQYLPLQLQRLSQNLALTNDQRVEIKPILEQEAGEVDEICFNPAISQSDKLNRYEKIVRESDEKMKPLLSGTQLQKLRDLRKEQKQKTKRLTEKSTGSGHGCS